MIKQPARLYTAIVGGFLLLQGVSTLIFRLYPPLDQAFPALLAVTQMVPAHSILHIVTGLLALGILFWGGERGAFWFALGFGIFYLGLAFVGMLSGQPMGLSLQPFDHPFHILVGGLGLVAVGVVLYQNRNRKQVTS
jgi:Domain of unknown function (DUF4383)